ncbi:MAG TPA: hypothetical protein VE956_13645 [Nodularia sp. (in: cyanobacteria)]|nr:hypothetical protein [Nodularia sp. (in: cyanobacteria)]
MPITSLNTNPTASSGLRTRQTITITTGGLLAGQSAKLLIPTGYKTFEILQVSTNALSRIRIYNNATYQINDEGRSMETEAIGDVGLLFEGVTSNAYSIINLSPITIVSAIPVSEQIAITINNISSLAVASITTELLIIGIE